MTFPSGRNNLLQEIKNNSLEIQSSFRETSNSFRRSNSSFRKKFLFQKILFSLRENKIPSGKKR